MQNNHEKEKVFSSFELGHMEKLGMGARRYTIQETETMGYLNKELLKSQIRGEKLTLKNNDKTRYFLVENGTVFKIDESTFLFYQLDLQNLKWVRNQAFAFLYYDSYLRFQELLYFKDYYDDADELYLQQ